MSDDNKKALNADVDMSVEFCKLHFPNPFVVGSGPCTDSAKKVIRAFRAGWGGAILKTISMNPERHTQVTPRFGRVMHKGRLAGFLNMEVSSPHSLEWWMQEVKKIKKVFPDRPVFASIMRTDERTKHDWVVATEAFQDAGVDGLELNFSCSHAFHMEGGGASIGKDPDATRRIAQWVVSVAKVPVIVKLPVLTSDIGNIAKVAVESGVNGITAINSVPGIGGIDLKTMTPLLSVDGFSSFTGFSGPAIRSIGLRCVGEIRRVVSVPMMGCGGIWGWKDVVEYLAMGTTLVQLCTGPMFQGFDMVNRLKAGLSKFLKEKHYKSVADIIGIVSEKYVDHSDLSRDYKVIANINLTKCKKCEQCFIACRDGANEAIELSVDGTPSVLRDRCIGCSLCQQVCQQKDCVTMVRI